MGTPDTIAIAEHMVEVEKEDRIAMVMNITYMHTALETFPVKVGY
jgi:hypothetical protein